MPREAALGTPHLLLRTRPTRVLVTAPSSQARRREAKCKQGLGVAVQIPLTRLVAPIQIWRPDNYI